MRRSYLLVSPPLSPRAYFGCRVKRLPFPLSDVGYTLYSRARHALWQGVRALGLGDGDEVLVPEYHCGTEIEVSSAVRNPGNYRYLLDHLSEFVSPPFEQLLALVDSEDRLLVANTDHEQHVVPFTQAAAVYDVRCSRLLPCRGTEKADGHASARRTVHLSLSCAGRSAGAVRRRPRLLIVVTLAEVGGAQTYVAGLLPGLQDFDVTVAAHGPGPLVAACERAGVAFMPLRWVRRPLHPVYDLLGLVELVRLMRRLRPDIVHLNSSKAGVLGRLAAAIARVPICIFTVHGWAFKAAEGPASALYLWADRLTRRLTDSIVCVSETERKAGIEARTCDSRRAIVIRNAVELGAPPREDRPARPPLILSAGRLKAPKDFMGLVRALRMIKQPFEALIAGEGPDREAIQQEIDRLGLHERVRLLGDRDDVPALLERASVFVLSSRSEGLPMSVLEAMAAGVPVVASSVDGIREVVLDGRTGLLTDVGNEEMLAAAIGHLLEDPERRREMGRNGRRRVEDHFDIERWREAHARLYRQALWQTSRK